jgi:hypothetical protein
MHTDEQKEKRNVNSPSEFLRAGFVNLNTNPCIKISVIGRIISAAALAK